MQYDSQYNFLLGAEQKTCYNFKPNQVSHWWRKDNKNAAFDISRVFWHEWDMAQSLMPWGREECHQTELADMKSLFKKFLNSYEIQLHVLRRDLLTPTLDNIFCWNWEETIKREIIFCTSSDQIQEKFDSLLLQAKRNRKEEI